MANKFIEVSPGVIVKKECIESVTDVSSKKTGVKSIVKTSKRAYESGIPYQALTQILEVYDDGIKTVMAKILDIKKTEGQFAG